MNITGPNQTSPTRLNEDIEACANARPVVDLTVFITPGMSTEVRAHIGDDTYIFELLSGLEAYELATSITLPGYRRTIGDGHRYKVQVRYQYER